MIGPALSGVVQQAGLGPLEPAIRVRIAAPELAAPWNPTHPALPYPWPVPDNRLAAIVLAAGLGKRFRSAATPKVLHPAAGEPLVGHVLRAVAGLPGLE